MSEPTYRIHGATGDWEVVIGLEVHAQIATQAKLFSGAATAFGAEPNTQVSLVDAAILKPLPVKDPDSLRVVEWTNDEFPAGVSNINGDFDCISGGRCQGSSVAAYLYRELAREQTAFAALVGAADPDSVAIIVNAAPAEQVKLQWVSSNFFQGLGVSPVIGRSFRDEEDRVGQEPVVIVSYRFWMSRFGASNPMLDRSVRINNVPAGLRVRGA